MIKKYLIPNRVLSPATFSLLVLALGFFENFSQKKRLPKIVGDLFRVKISLKWAIIPFFRYSKILGEAEKQVILEKMFRKF